MRSTEFLVEDYCEIAWNEFISDLDDEYRSKGLIFESTRPDIPRFIASCAANPVIGNVYFCVTVVWVDQGAIRTISIASSDEQYKLLEVGEKIIVENIQSGKIRAFPELAGPVSSNIMCAGLFDTKNDKDQFKTMFILKYRGEFNIKEKVL